MAPKKHPSFHNNCGIMCLPFCHVLQGMIIFLWLLCGFWSPAHVQARVEEGLTHLTIEVHTVQPSSVDLAWSTQYTNSTELRNSALCSVIIWSSVDSRQVLENYNLQYPFIHVRYLEEKTQYALFLKCQMNGTAFQSNIVDFRTGSRSLLPVSTTTTSPSLPDRNDHTETKDTGRKESSFTGDRSETDVNSSSSSNNNVSDRDSPTIYKHKLSAFSNVLDATLGIMFAVFGGVVALVTACYVWKGWQRRQRFHRFMRHQDSSDQFDIIRQNISESS